MPAAPGSPIRNLHLALLLCKQQRKDTNLQSNPLHLKNEEKSLDPRPVKAPREPKASTLQNSTAAEQLAIEQQAAVNWKTNPVYMGSQPQRLSRGYPTGLAGKRLKTAKNYMHS